MKSYSTGKKTPTPACLLCNQNSQNSEHRFYNCPEVRPVWDLTSNLLQCCGIFIFIDKQTALLNSLDEHKNSFTTTVINYTRKLIDNAHSSNNKIHPNTFLHKLKDIANIFKYNDNKYYNQWNRLEIRTQELLSPHNPQTMSALPKQNVQSFTLNTDCMKIANVN